MRNKLITTAVSSLMVASLLSMNTVNAAVNIFSPANVSGTTASYKASEAGFKSIYSDLLTPTYYIFAGARTDQQANELIDELGMMANIEEWASDVNVISPLNGTDYTQADMDAFINSVGIARNVKVIGIDTGATFVNNFISQNCYFVAGIMVYGGEMNEGMDYNVAVPAYLSNQSETAVNYYKQANGTDSNQSNEGYELDSNKAHPLQQVGIANGEETLAQAFANAWDAVFSKNYRHHISTTEFYNMPVTGVNYVGSVLENAFEPYTLVEIPQFDDLGITYNQMFDQPVSNMPGAYTWFEYLPEDTLASADGSVPLVVTLHGNQNDPRLQGDASGWVELAAQENFMVVSPEYQDKSENNFFGGDGLGDEGLYNLIKDLEVKYPQIDSSRIYVTGLSQGGAKSSLLGIKYSDVFAAVGVVSGVNVYNDEIQSLVADYQGNQTAYLYMCGDHDFFQMIPVDGSSTHGLTELTNGEANIWQLDPNTHIYPALQAYQKINGLEVTEMDMAANSYYGMALDNWHDETLGDKTMHVGTLSNDKGVVMQLAAVENLAHWNYKPEAAYIWDFFNNYQRDMATGELVLVNNDSNSISPFVIVGGMAVIGVAIYIVIKRTKKA